MFKTLAASAAVLALALASGAHATAPKIKTVFYIALENHNATQPSSYTGTNAIYGNAAAPFINSLITPGNPNAAMVSYASHYNNVVELGTTVHPSEPNYVWSEAGTAINNSNVRNDANPYSSTGAPTNIVNAPNLSALLQAKGINWTSYQEDADLLNTTGQTFVADQTGATNGTITSNVASPSQYVVPLNSFSGTSSDYVNAYNGSNQYNYASKHNPQLFFTATNGGNNITSSNPEASHYAPLQALATDLANNTVTGYNFITPDQYNDMHTALTGGFTYNGVHYTGDEAQIAQGDNFLSQIVPLIEASQAFKDNGEIVIWNDEDEGDNAATDSQFSGVEIVISPLAKGNAYDSTISYNHSSDLKTLQEIYGVTGTALGAAAGANTLADLYKPGAVPEPAAWSMMLVGFGLLGGALRRRARPAVASA